jgi:glycosyltransferase involved in cell wall biosynthesis
MKVAVITTTYNRPDALSATLEAFRVQTDRDFEMIVADDGSTAETAETVNATVKRLPFRLTHVWQEDQGFRAGGIRNRALAATVADYIIFSDGDCIPMPDFVEQHRRLAEPERFVAGSRILLSRGLTERVLAEGVALHEWDTRQWLRAYLQKDVNRLFPVLSLPLPGMLRRWAKDDWQGVMTCNLSCWRKDLIRINGFDETYHGWGLEDSDLVVRLLRSGVKRKSARFAATVLHLWHKEYDRLQLEENRKRLNDVLNSSRVRAIRGVDQYL